MPGRLKNHTTFKLGGTPTLFRELHSKEDIIEAVQEAQIKKVPFFALGGGSNIVVSDTDTELKLCVGKMLIKGIKILTETDSYTDIRFGGGEVWDDCVQYTVAQGLSGIEAMAKIPGTMGAAPVQNIGAYGQELADTFLELEAYDIEQKRFVILEKEQCAFSYRDSLFKREPGRYVIVSVTLRLSKQQPTLPDYPGVKKYFEEHLFDVTLENIYTAIAAIRATKLPEPSTIPNVGSFFKNPIVGQTLLKNIQKKYPDMPHIEINNTHTKIPAGWLIEQTGLKGKTIGPITVYKHNALVLTNTGDASYEETLHARDTIKDAVQEHFGITLEMEPLLITG